LADFTYRITKQFPHLLSSTERRELSRLTARDRGEMQWQFHEIKSKKDGFCLVARTETGFLVGWALIFHGSCNFVVNPETGLREDDDSVVWEAHVYVRQANRRQGIGTALMRQALKHTRGNVAIHKHNNSSSRFYTSCEKMSKKYRLREI